MTGEEKFEGSFDRCCQKISMATEVKTRIVCRRKGTASFT